MASQRSTAKRLVSRVSGFGAAGVILTPLLPSPHCWKQKGAEHGPGGRCPPMPGTHRPGGGCTYTRRPHTGRGEACRLRAVTFGVFSTNLCFPSSPPSCAFISSSFATSFAICGGKERGAGRYRSLVPVTPPPPPPAPHGPGPPQPPRSPPHPLGVGLVLLQPPHHLRLLPHSRRCRLSRHGRACAMPPPRLTGRS